MKFRGVRLIALLLIVTMLLSGCQEYRAYEWEEDYSSSSTSSSVEPIEFDPLLLDYEYRHKDDGEAYFDEDTNTVICNDVELTIDKMEIIPRGDANNPEDYDVLLFWYTVKNCYDLPIDAVTQGFDEHFSPQEIVVNARDYNVMYQLDEPVIIEPGETYSSSFGFRIMDNSPTITLFFMGGSPLEFVKETEVDLLSLRNPDMTDEERALVDEITQNEVAAGIDAKDVLVTLIDDEKMCTVTVTMENIGVGANAPELEKEWESFQLFLKLNNQNLRMLLDEKGMTDWSAIHIVKDQYDTVQIVVENGQILTP